MTDRIDVDYDGKGNPTAVRLNGVLLRGPCALSYPGRVGIICPQLQLNMANVELREYHPTPPHSPWKWLQEFQQQMQQRR